MQFVSTSLDEETADELASRVEEKFTKFSGKRRDASKNLCI